MLKTHVFIPIKQIQQMLTRGERKNVFVWFEKVKSLTLINTTNTTTTIVWTLRARDPLTFSVVLHTSDVSDNNNNNNN